jgi:hypothetical protein
LPALGYRDYCKAPTAFATATRTHTENPAMANRHEVTVHIWPNTPAFEQWLGGPRRNKRPENFISGHAALKLQTINANKGDYYYLSMLPNQGEIHIRGEKIEPRKGHVLAMRYGQNSKSAALLLPVEDQKLFETSNQGSIDKDIFKGSAKTTYRFTGPNFNAMVAFINGLANPVVRLWDMYNYNCAQAVADCLKAGGAVSPPTYTNFTPNRVAEWCQVLCATYPGSEIKGG